MMFEEDDIVTHTKKGGLYKIKGLRERSNTMYVCEDIEPDGQRIWHQRTNGGGYTTKFVNGFLGEIELIHRKFLKKTNE